MTTFFYLIVILAFGTLGAIVVNLLTRDTRRPDARLVVALFVLIVLGATVQTLKETQLTDVPERASPFTDPTESTSAAPTAGSPVDINSPSSALPADVLAVPSLTTYIEDLEVAPTS
ncbi:MAG: hypothetical protein ACRDS1_16040 [Pseudonocardiaceae bacterium]